MIDGWLWFVLPMLLPAGIVAVSVYTSFGPDVLPAHMPPKNSAKKRKLGLNAWPARLGISLFCGVFIVGIGFGAVFPVIDRIAAPIACGQRQLDLKTSTWKTPGTMRVFEHWSCLDAASGVREDIGGIGLPGTAGLLYGVIIFAVWTLILLWLPRARQNALARMTTAKVTIESVTWGDDDGDPSEFRLQVHPPQGAPFVLTVKKQRYAELVGRHDRKSWGSCQRGSHFTAEYDPRWRKRLYVVSTA